MRQWNDKFKMLQAKKTCQPRILYLGKLAFRNENEKETFSHKGWENLLLADLSYKKY